MVKHYEKFLIEVAKKIRRLPKNALAAAAKKIIGGSASELALFGAGLQNAFCYCRGKTKGQTTGQRLSGHVKRVVDAFYQNPDSNVETSQTQSPSPSPSPPRSVELPCTTTSPNHDERKILAAYGVKAGPGPKVAMVSLASNSTIDSSSESGDKAIIRMTRHKYTPGQEYTQIVVHAASSEGCACFLVSGMVE